MARFSTGLRNALATNYGLGVMMNGGVLLVYGNEPPDSPDDAPGESEIARVTTGGLPFVPGTTSGGGGIMLELVTAGALAAVGELRLRGIREARARWWRWCWSRPDPQVQSTYYPRVDGDVPGELRLNTWTIAATTDEPVDQFLFLLPMGG